jgi:tRNA(adenine34) deaminase
MRRALRLAEKAAALDEVPVGAIIVRGPLDSARPEILARAHNLVEGPQDPCGHAELRAIRAAAKRLGRWRLNDCTLIVTLEPCAMCAGALVWSRMGRVVFGAADPKAGACGSVLNVIPNGKLNHRPALEGGVLEGPCGELLRDFFRNKRRKGKP